MEPIARPRAAAPWHLWAVGAASLLWNSFGCIDYTMMKTHNARWLAAGNVSREMLAQIDAAPLWGTTGWALGVWGSLAGSLLLLLRSRHAPAAFLVSLFGALVGFAWQLRAGMIASPALPLTIAAIVLALWGYARAMARRGVLS